MAKKGGSSSLSGELIGFLGLVGFMVLMATIPAVTIGITLLVVVIGVIGALMGSGSSEDYPHNG